MYPADQNTTAMVIQRAEELRNRAFGASVEEASVFFGVDRQGRGNG
jgi:hypothetical protein